MNQAFVEQAFKHTPIGTIPAEWDVVSLGDVCQVDWGNTSLTKELYRQSGYQAFSAAGQDGFLDFYEHEGNAVILSAIGARSGKCFFASGKWTAIKNTIIIKASDNQRADIRFVYYYVNDESYWSRHGSGQPFIAIGSAKREILPLPSLSEQRAIAAILYKIQQAVEVQEKIIERTKELKKSLMAKLFTEGLHGEELKETEIGLMPKSWEVVRLGDLFKLSSGDTRPKDLSNTVSETHQYPVYGGNGILGYSQRYFISEPTLVLGRVGVYCGNAYVSEGKCWISDNALYTKEILHDFNLLYLCEFLRFYDLNRFRHMGGQPLITQGIVHQQRIPIPPMSEQAEIAKILSTVSEKISTAENKMLKLQQLFKSMLHQLMTGKIRVNNIKIENDG